MSRDLGTLDAPPATRAAAPGWRDARLWIGVALVAASVLVGARLVDAAGDTTQVWAARSDLQPGAAVDPRDLTPVAVRLDAERAQAYLPASAPLPDGEVLTRLVAAGELVPRAALGEPAAARLEVPVWAPADAVPAGLAPGAVVDVWVAGDRGKAAAAVLDDVVVVAVPVDDQGLGPGGSRQVIVGVPEGQRARVGAVLSAAHEGRVALTREG